MENFSIRINQTKVNGISEKDSVLIIYSDQIQQPGEKPLRTLASFCSTHLLDLISYIHLLPFYPYSSDDGFSVIDYQAVDSNLGTWEDISTLNTNFQLMFDAVINHVSVQHQWFQGFLAGDSRFKDFFIEVNEEFDLTNVVRPRVSPLLTSFSTKSGEKKVWTTFSSDQVDLNYQNPNVLLEIIKLLLFYISKGAEIIRLDAIAYLWKEFGTPCIHLPQTHTIIRIFRAIFEEIAPRVKLITETNVRHEDNISYFGDGSNESHLVYNFTLPPLVLYTLQTGDAGILSKWVRSLRLPSKSVTFLNFLASHDGIGITPLIDLLPESSIDSLVSRILDLGGLISYRTNPDGSKSPYELNINYFDALSVPNKQESLETQVNRFCAAHAISFSIAGLPAIYFHSFVGSLGWPEGVKITGQKRTINRQKLNIDILESEMFYSGSRRSIVFENIKKLLIARQSNNAFNPYGDQVVLDYGGPIFAIIRNSPDQINRILCLQNVTSEYHSVHLELEEINKYKDNKQLINLVDGKIVAIQQNDTILLDPYTTLWIDISNNR